MTDLPRLSTIPPGTRFTDALATRVMDRFGSDDPLALADVLILLPTRRSVRTLTDAFARVAATRGATTLIMPRIQPVGDVDEEELVLESANETAEEALSLPPTISDFERRTLLAVLVRRLFEAEGRASDAERDLAVADSLAHFLDTAETERISLDQLDKLVPEDFAEHWQITLKFLDLLRVGWPAILKERGLLNAAERRNRLLATLAAKWREMPPGFPVIAAGSTGSIPATADLLKVVADLPTGHVVLPGLDQDMDEASWDALEPSHPQFGLKALLNHMDATRGDVVPLIAEPETLKKRRILINEALRPSAATDEWINAVKTIDVDTACEGLSFLIARHSGEEALAVALMLREQLEQPGKTAALITPDRTLARRVAAEMRRFGVEMDDSAGTPLSQTPPAHHFETLIRAVAANWSPVTLLAALKSPFTRLGRKRGATRDAIDALERYGLRGVLAGSGLDYVEEALKAAAAHHTRKDRLAAIESARALLEDLREATAPLEAMRARPASLPDWAAMLSQVGEALAQDEHGNADDLRTGPAGEKLTAFFDQLQDTPEEFGTLALDDFASAFSLLMREQAVRSAAPAHPRLSIWGPLEARLQQADLMILGGLTESVWPMDVSLDPWLSRPMRARLNLSPPERRIGLSAHDFAQLAASPRVVLTRSEKVDGQPAVPSRWWLRLQTLLRGAGLENLSSLTEPHARWAEELDRSAAPTPCEAPKPCPPADVRPTGFRVTEIETWFRDPYAIYARHVLGLDPLDPLQNEPGPRERGTLVHAVLEEFANAHPRELGPHALEDLLTIARKHFDALWDRPEIAAIWWPRFERIAAWFIDEERKMRAGLSEILTEQSGTLNFDVNGTTYELRARADRIERREDGSAVIADYKTGAMPAKKDCEAGLAPQVTLEAAMAARGAFGADVPTTVSGLTYIGLKWSRDPGEVRRMTEDADTTQEWAEYAFEELRGLIAKFQDANRPYPSQPRPRLQSAWGDYDHLARRLEWSVYGGDDGGDGDG